MSKTNVNSQDGGRGSHLGFLNTSKTKVACICHNEEPKMIWNKCVHVDIHALQSPTKFFFYIRIFFFSPEIAQNKLWREDEFFFFFQNGRHGGHFGFWNTAKIYRFRLLIITKVHTKFENNPFIIDLSGALTRKSQKCRFFYTITAVVAILDFETRPKSIGSIFSS